ncbi:MAG: hypothetical protein KDD62_07920 [Bdellovibrionales bacterium]|nr:hypothetical protein [Bdellovibrionales bacterium]
MTNPSQAADLFDMAESLGELSNDSVSLLDPLQTEINAALAQGEKKRAAKVLLLTVCIDNSPSMAWKGQGSIQNNWEIACGGQNLVFDSMVDSKAAKSVLAHACFLNDFDGNHGIFFPFRDLVKPDHSKKNRQPNFVVINPSDGRLLGGTPLCGRMLTTLGAVQAQATDYTKDGSDVLSITIFQTDGGNNVWDHNEAEVNTLVTDMRRQERHKIYLGGIDDGVTNYEKFGIDCGLDPDCVRKLPNDPSEIRAWLEQVSQSAVAASEAADLDAFSQIKL